MSGECALMRSRYLGGISSGRILESGWAEGVRPATGFAMAALVGAGRRKLIYLCEVVAAHCSWIFLPFPGVAGFRAVQYNLESALRPGSSVVERGPEKAGVGGSIPSLATTSFKAV